MYDIIHIFFIMYKLLMNPNYYYYGGARKTKDPDPFAPNWRAHLKQCAAAYQEQKAAYYSRPKVTLNILPPTPKINSLPPINYIPPPPVLPPRPVGPPLPLRPVKIIFPQKTGTGRRRRR